MELAKTIMDAILSEMDVTGITKTQTAAVAMTGQSSLLKNNAVLAEEAMSGKTLLLEKEVTVLLT